MQFNAAIIPYEGSDHWVEDKLIEAKKTLESVQQPMHGSGCDVARFLSQTLLFSTPNPLINSAASALPKAQMLQQQLKAKLSPKMQELLSEDQKSRRKFDTSRSKDRLFSFLFTNKIICPKPIPWQKQYKTIASIYDKEERAFELHLPLILHGWYASSANEKRTMFLHHIEVAEQLGILRPIADQFTRLPISEFLLESEVIRESER